MIAFNARFDGKVLVPDEPLDLPANQKVRIELKSIETIAATDKPKRILGRQVGQIVYLAPDWDAPLADDLWEHNNEIEAKP